MSKVNTTNQDTANNKFQPIIKLIARELRKNHIGYNESKYIFKQARQIAELKPPKNRKKGTITRLSKDELENFLIESYKQSAITGLMMQTLYETAARVSEFVNLQPDDIYPTDQVIVIRSGKGNKRREVPVDQGLIRAIQLHLNGRRNGYIFESNQNRKYSTRRIEQIVKKIGEDAGIGITVTPHLLRHTRATLLAEAGMRKDHLQILLGHESANTTEIYTHTAALGLKREFKKIS